MGGCSTANIASIRPVISGRSHIIMEEACKHYKSTQRLPGITTFANTSIYNNYTYIAYITYTMLNITSLNKNLLFYAM